MLDSEQIKQEIDDVVDKYVSKNRGLLEEVEEYQESKDVIQFIIEEDKIINMYLSEVKIMLITANTTERDTLFSYFAPHSRFHIVKIYKNNITYSFFKINNNKVVHIEPYGMGSYADGGVATILKEAIDVVRPNVVIMVGVAYGANYKTNEIGDVLVGRQHFSYDKSTKISNGKLGIKKLHVEEPDGYMVSRLKSNVNLELKTKGKFGNAFSVIFGNMVTGEFVVDSVEIRNMIFSPFEPFGIIGGEMEAYGIFEEIKKYPNIHCILIKGICDWGAGKNDEIAIKQKDSVDSDEKAKIEENDFKIDDNISKETSKKNYKNVFQTLAMANACVVCNELLLDAAMYSDIEIDGSFKRFWRSGIGRIIKDHKVKEKFE